MFFNKDIFNLLGCEIDEENCKCLIYIASSNKIYEIQLKDKSIKQIFMIEEPIHFTSILQQEEKIIFATINNKIYLWNLHKNLTEPNDHYSFKNLSTLKGLTISRNALLKIAVGNPSSKQKYPASNIIILQSIKHGTTMDEIFFKLMISFKNRIIKDQDLKEPLNIDDFVCLISENHKIFIEFVDFLKALFEEQNHPEGIPKIKKITLNRQNLINTKKKIDHFIPNKEIQNFMMGRLLFSVLMLHKEDFDTFLSETKKNFLIKFYNDLLRTKIPQIESKINEDFSPLKVLFENLRKNLHSHNNGQEELSWFCKICKIHKCKNDHKFLKCILTQQDIYLEKFYICKFCSSGITDVEEEFKLSPENLGFSFNICPICSHLVKSPLEKLF